MTLIYTPRHMDQLVSEIKNEWPKSDPDLQRVADALPLANIEKAYVKKLYDVAAPQPALLRAEAVSQKLLVMRKIYLAWLRSPTQRLGQLLWNTVVPRVPPQGSSPFQPHDELFFIEDGPLADAVEKGYPPSK